MIKNVLKNALANMLRKERKWNHIKCSIKITKVRDSIEDKNKNKEQKKKWKIQANKIDINLTIQ